MAKTDNNIVAQALLDAENIKSTIKEESKNTLNSLLKEAVADTIRTIVEGKEEDAEDEKDYEVLDDTEKNDADAENAEVETSEDESETNPAEDEEGDEEGEDEGWDQFSQYQTGDKNTYDLTSEEDYDNVVKVYKLLKDDDNIVVKKDGDKITLKDENADTEYVIDLGTEEDEDAEVDGEETIEEPLQESMDEPAGFIDDDEDEIDLELDEPEDEFDDFEEEFPEDNNNMLEGKTQNKMKKQKEAIFEIDLGYTDNYQDKDPIEGLSATEPSKSGKSWEKGVPTDAKKPWAGDAKPKGQPFEKTVNEEEMPEGEIEEGTNVGGAVQQRTSSKSHIPAGRKEYGPKAKRHVSAGGEYTEVVAEAKEKLTKVLKENKELKNAVIELKKSLNEAYVTNVNLGRIVKLFTENTTSKNEKVDIVNRFVNEAKTIEQSKSLYESISKELNKEAKKTITLESANISMEGTKALNEEKVVKSQDLLNTIDFMRRMNEC